MNLGWHDLAGGVGVVLVLWAYFRLQAGTLRSESLAYSLYNLVGAGLIVLSLMYTFNLAAFLVEGAWVLISAYGVARWWRRRKVGEASKV